MRFMCFEICNAAGDALSRQHPREWIEASSIKRIVKQPKVDNVTFLDLGISGIWVRGDFDKIADMLNGLEGETTKQA